MKPLPASKSILEGLHKETVSFLSQLLKRTLYIEKEMNGESASRELCQHQTPAQQIKILSKDGVLSQRFREEVEKLDLESVPRMVSIREYLPADEVQLLLDEGRRNKEDCKHAWQSAGGRQQAVFLPVKRLVPCRQQTVHLTGGDLHAQLPQLLVQQRLRDVVVKMLIQHVPPQRGTEVRGDPFRQAGREERPVRQAIASAAILRVVRLDPQILDREILIADERGPGGQVLQQQRQRLVNGQVAGLGTFRRTGPFSAGRLALLPAGGCHALTPVGG